MVINHLLNGMILQVGEGTIGRWLTWFSTPFVWEKKHAVLNKTPEKLIMELSNYPIENEDHLPSLLFWGSMLIFQGVHEKFYLGVWSGACFAQDHTSCMLASFRRVVRGLSESWPCFFVFVLIKEPIEKATLPETNIAPSFLLGWPVFRCCVSFREGISTYI